MKVLLIVIVGLAIGAAGAHWRYSAFMPCEIMRIQFLRGVLEETGNLEFEAPKNETRAAGQALNPEMDKAPVGIVVDRHFDSLSQLECFQMILRDEQRGIIKTGTGADVRRD